MAKEKYPQKKDPLLFLFLLRKNSVKKKLINQELEFAEGFRRIKILTFDKHILQRSYYLIHKI